MGIDNGKLRAAHRDTFPFTAGQYLYKHGAMLEVDLFKAMGDGIRANGRDELIQRCLRTGWFTLTAGGKVNISEFAREHYDKEAGVVKVKHIGQVATSRAATAYERPPLSKKYLINSRGLRQDVPAWSVPGQRTFHRG